MKLAEPSQSKTCQDVSILEALMPNCGPSTRYICGKRLASPCTISCLTPLQPPKTASHEVSCEICLTHVIDFAIKADQCFSRRLELVFSAQIDEMHGHTICLPRIKNHYCTISGGAASIMMMLIFEKSSSGSTGKALFGASNENPSYARTSPHREAFLARCLVGRSPKARQQFPCYKQ